MTTYDFTKLGNYGNNPLRAEGLRIASTLDLDAIDVDVWAGPIGSHGFRRGYWHATAPNGRKLRFFSSISHNVELDRQRQALTRDAALAIGLLEAGYRTGIADWVQRTPTGWREIDTSTPMKE